MIVLKKQINVTVLLKFVAAFNASNRVSGKNYLNKLSLVAQGRSHLLMREPSGKRKKYEERKEVILSLIPIETMIEREVMKIPDIKIISLAS